MKRDIDLVRKILMTCIDHEHGFAPRTLTVEGYSEEAIGHHAYLMAQAGLVEAHDTTTRGDLSPQSFITSVTWAGHEFLEASRDEGLWSKAKRAMGATGGMAFDVVKAVLTSVAIDTAKKAVGLP